MSARSVVEALGRVLELREAQAIHSQPDADQHATELDRSVERMAVGDEQ